MDIKQEQYELASRISMGLVGWQYSASARCLTARPDENAARHEICNILTAQPYRQYAPETNVLPPTWPRHSREKVDIGLNPRVGPKDMRFGALELKWDSGRFAGDARKDLVQDVIRLSTIQASDPSIRFLVLGSGLSNDNLIGANHDKPELASQVETLSKTISFNLHYPRLEIDLSEVEIAFPNCKFRLPKKVICPQRIRTTLLAFEEVTRKTPCLEMPGTIRQDKWGKIWIWQIDPL